MKSVWLFNKEPLICDWRWMVTWWGNNAGTSVMGRAESCRLFHRGALCFAFSLQAVWVISFS